MGAGDEKTSTFSVNDVGDPEAVTATIQCREIWIMEDPSVAGWPTTDFKIFGSLADTGIQRNGGTSWIFYQRQDIGQPRKFNPGEVVGYVSTVTGTTTFQKREIP